MNSSPLYPKNFSTTVSYSPNENQQSLPQQSSNFGGSALQMLLPLLMGKGSSANVLENLTSTQNSAQNQLLSALSSQSSAENPLLSAFSAGGSQQLTNLLGGLTKQNPKPISQVKNDNLENHYSPID